MPGLQHTTEAACMHLRCAARLQCVPGGLLDRQADKFLLHDS